MADAPHASEQQSERGEGSLSFLAFVLSLAHTTAVHLGDVPDPASGHPSPPNLPAASQMIDILALLEQVLYELRLRFVEVRSAATGAAPEAQAETTTVPPSGSRTPSGIIIP